MVLKSSLKLLAWKAGNEFGCGWNWHRIISTGKLGYWQFLGFHSGTVEVFLWCCTAWLVPNMWGLCGGPIFNGQM